MAPNTYLWLVKTMQKKFSAIVPLGSQWEEPTDWLTVSGLSREAWWGRCCGGQKPFADGEQNQAVGFWRRQNDHLHFSVE